MLARLLAHLQRQWMGALALFLVLTGGVAYAANTIGSSDIIDESILSQDVKNGEVKTADIGTNQVRSADVRNDSLAGGGLTGADINESGLGIVPNADQLDGTDSTGFAKGFGNVGTFGNGGLLALSVPGFGSFEMECSSGVPPTPGIDYDDEVGDFIFVNQSGSSVTLGFTRQTNLSGGNSVSMQEVPAASQYRFAQSSTSPMHSDVVATSTATGAPAVTASLVGAQWPGSDDCKGAIHAIRSG
jgi:hypothetical protein